MSLATGQLVLDRYVVDGFLSEGGMGSVYRGHHARLDRPVVLKVVTSDGSSDLLARFEREAMLMARVRHPNVVGILDYGVLPDGRPCIAMELAEGTDLGRVLKAGGPLPWREAVPILDGVLAGLAAIHQAGVLHRDLKPANVVVPDAPPVTPRLIDFGIACPTERRGDALTRTGTVLGTPAYMPPEQLLGYALDARTDLYAAALLAYELLTGDLPFPPGSVRDVMRRLSEPCPPPVAPAGRPPLPPGLVALLAAMLEREPERRPATANDARRRLRERPSPVPPATTPAPVAPSSTPGSAPGSTAPSGCLVFVAAVPRARLGMPDERRWLAGLAGDDGRGFVFRGEWWVVLFDGLDGAPGPRAAALEVQLLRRYGPATRTAWRLLERAPELTAAHLAGAARLPAELSALLDAAHAPDREPGGAR